VSIKFWLRSSLTGEQTPAEVTHLQDHGQPVTRLHLKLAPPVTAVFAVTPGTDVSVAKKP